MKNLLKTLTVTAVMVGMSGGVAFADSNCEISNTGPGSENTCTSEETNETTVSCVNGVYIVNTNDQEAGSGDGEVGGNTSGGGATTGSATNENGTTVQIGASCGDEAVVTPTTTTPTPPAGGAGSDSPQVLGDEVAQVSVKPVGGAGAGAGAGDSSTEAATTTGILGSLAMIVTGLALRKNALGRN